MDTMKKVLSFIFLGLLWFFSSPIYVLVNIFVYKRKVWGTLLFALLSPSTWVLTMNTYHKVSAFYEHAYRLTSRGELSTITGVELPVYQIVDKDLRGGRFNQKYTNKYTIEFKAQPDEAFYAKLDSVCLVDPHWSCGVEDEQVAYSYNRMWGKGMEAPEGQNPDEVLFVNLSITKGRRKAALSKGRW